MARQPIVIDGANVAWEWLTPDGHPRVSNIVSVIRTAEALGYTPITIIDATLRHRVDDPEQLEGLLRRGTVLQAPSGTGADYFVLETAAERGCAVISNDEFAPYRGHHAWVKRRRVPFMIVAGSVHLHEPTLREISDRASRERSEQRAGAAGTQPAEVRR